MLVYGDDEAAERLSTVRDEVLAALAHAEELPPGLGRHAALVEAFIRLSEAVQALSDAGFEARGADRVAPEGDPGMPALMTLAAAIDRSWRSGFELREPTVPVAEAVRRLAGPEILRTRRAEGYAFYALYPESYLDAAHRSGLPPETGVIGLRSIGCGLAALVAAALGAPPPLTVRPVGHPFRRHLRIDQDGVAAWLARHRAFAVVDEGPGLSGSSFGAVLDWLEGQGVPRERIHLFPSHAGDLGPEASAAHRARWAGLSRHVGLGESLVTHLAAWLERSFGPLEAPLEDISGGAWRALRGSEETWPASNVQQERLKFLVRIRGGTWLAKFAGLGAVGRSKLALARALSDAGFTPEPADLGHGFLVERWVEGARRLDEVTVSRERLIERFAAYLGFRARRFAGARPGASLDEMLHMARHNADLALGEGAGPALQLDPGPLGRCVRPVVTDNRMLPQEWLLTEGGRLLKTDALDHHAAHDLVGCQDIAWDVAGTALEFDFTAEETRRLAERVGAESGRAVDPGLLAFYRPCYLAFRLGALTMAAQANGGEEAARLRAAADRYAVRLAKMIEDARPTA